MLVIDADLRGRGLTRSLGLESRLGFADMLEQSLQRKGIEGVVLPYGQHLDVVPAGTPVSDAAELLNAPDMRDLLVLLKQTYDYVLIDSAPLTSVADGLTLAQAAEGAVLVCRADRTTKAAIQQSIWLLDRLSVPLLGVVLNDVSARSAIFSYPYTHANFEEPPTTLSGIQTGSEIGRIQA